MKTLVENRLGLIRKSRGVGASDLARRVHVSRQTIYAIEAGTYVPNTEVALNLARELGVTVDELFTLRQGLQKSPESLAAEVLSSTAPAKGQPVRICQIGSRWVGVPVSASPYYMPEADGIIKRTGRVKGRAELVVFAKEEAAQKRLVLAGCDPATILRELAALVPQRPRVFAPLSPDGRQTIFRVAGPGSTFVPNKVIYFLERSKPMEPTRPKLPREAIDLYNLFIHGEISRRDFMDGVQRYAVGGLAAATIIEALMPNYALGQQVSKTDDRIKATYETVPSPQGNGSIKGYLVRPVSADTRAATAAKLPGILVVHENRGLNPHIEDVARRLALANFMAFAPDGLTSVGGFPGDDYHGGQLFSKVDSKKMGEDFVAAAMWLKSRADCTGKIGATGFCYGGGVANTLAVRLGADINAAVPFYGAVPAKEEIPKIKAAILVHHGELDTRLAATWPAYDMALEEANVPHEGYIYPGAVHGFNCDATPERYNKAAADLAWQRTIDWFNKYVRV